MGEALNNPALDERFNKKKCVNVPIKQKTVSVKDCE